MTERHTSLFHSVILDEAECKGCTICITSCPVEAIRIRDGKAHILEERCIDCGECIRRCPNFAKKAYTPERSILQKYPQRVALIAPTVYAQFSENYSIDRIRRAFLKIGFTAVFDVAQAAQKVSDETASFLSSNGNNSQNAVLLNDVVRPVLSSACPVIIKLIQVRFATLIDHILPILPPVEVAAQSVRNTHPLDTGVFFISPCPSKITASRSPLGFKESAIDAVFAISDLYLPLVSALKETSTEYEEDCQSSIENTPYNWAYAEGEISELCTRYENNTHKKLKWLSADGITQVIKTLEAVEDGKLAQYDFIELSACTAGCVGGALTLALSCEAKALIRHKMQIEVKRQETSGANAKIPQTDIAKNKNINMYFTQEIPVRSALRLDNNYEKARHMMEEIEEIYHSLPGFDCGSCGSPNCHALAEDIVRAKAKSAMDSNTIPCGAQRTDCIFILREQYEKLLLRSTCRLKLQKNIYARTSDHTLKKSGSQAAKILCNTLLFQQASLLLLFISTPQEMDTSFVLKEALRQGKKIALPRVTSPDITRADMEFYYIDADRPLNEQLVEGYFGLLEPSQSSERVLLKDNSPLFDEHTLMILPGLAFSEKGSRLGKGGGYYDRFFARMPRLMQCRIGFCFDFQIIDSIPTTKRDIAMTHIISDKRFIVIS